MSRREINAEQGSALIVALVLLVVITLISITAMQTSTMELRMAGNVQEYRIGLDSVESATDAVIHSSNLVIERDNATSCFFFGNSGEDEEGNPLEPSLLARISAFQNNNNCDAINTLVAGGGVSTTANNNTVLVTVEGTGGCPPGMATSLTLQRHNVIDTGQGSTGSCAYLSAVSRYDRTENMGSRVEIEQGLMRFLPGS